jgi:hypothetical protein
MNWSYGVTTVPERQYDPLPRTLDSLRRAGFPTPRLFVDGMVAGHPHACSAGGPHATYRYPRIGAWANFILGLYELYAREPACDRYAMFQDDVLAVRDLKAYLDQCRYPDGRDGREPGFWSLYTASVSEWKAADAGSRCGWIQGAELAGQPLPSMRLQWCKGALGFVFNREAAGLLLTSPVVAQKPISTDRPSRNVDGCVVTAMNMARSERWPFGWREYVHGPSLLQHVGRESTVKPGKVWERGSATWPGEEWSALEMLTR